MTLFEITNILFSSPSKWKNIPRGEKKKNFFMINRMFAIQHPLQAQAFNHLRIDQVSSVNFWQVFMRTLYHKTPFWMYTKGAKKQQKEREKKLNIKESTVKKYASQFNLDIKSVRDAIKFFPKESSVELKKFEKMIK